MKTSNKILLGFFLALVLIISALHISLFAKYKAGKITKDGNAATENWKKYGPGKIRYVSVIGLEQCSVMPADSVEINSWQADGGRMLIRVVQDTLFVYGDSLMSTPGYNQTKRVYQQVTLFLPEMKMIKGTNAELHFVGSGDSLHAQQYHIQLHDANLRLAEVRGEGNTAGSYYRSLTIHASHSSHVDLAPNAMIGNLDVALDESMLNDQKAAIDSIQLTLDDKSEVIFHGANLKKINLTNK